jgi:hypothetical protein
VESAGQVKSAAEQIASCSPPVDVEPLVLPPVDPVPVASPDSDCDDQDVSALVVEPLSAWVVPLLAVVVPSVVSTVVIGMPVLTLVPVVVSDDVLVDVSAPGEVSLVLLNAGLAAVQPAINTAIDHPRRVTDPGYRTRADDGVHSRSCTNHS